MITAQSDVDICQCLKYVLRMTLSHYHAHIQLSLCKTVELVSAPVRGRVLRVPLAGRNPAALDRLSEEQGPEGGALAHPDQRAAWIHPAGLNRASVLHRRGAFIACWTHPTNLVLLMRSDQYWTAGCR